jgi:hypothetical protein
MLLVTVAAAVAATAVALLVLVLITDPPEVFEQIHGYLYPIASVAVVGGAAILLTFAARLFLWAKRRLSGAAQSLAGGEPSEEVAPLAQILQQSVEELCQALEKRRTAGQSAEEATPPEPDAEEARNGETQEKATEIQPSAGDLRQPAVGHPK